jgi:hypothetical protein
MYRIQFITVARSAISVATVAPILYVVMFIALCISWALSRQMAHQPTHLPSVKDIAAIPLIMVLAFVVTWIFFYPLAALFCFLYNQVAKLTGGIEFSIF